MTTNALRGNALLLALAPTYAATTGYVTVAALKTTSLVINNTSVDITNKDSAGYMELLAGGGVKSAKITAAGIFTDVASQIAMQTALLAATHWNIQITDDSGATYVFAAHFDSLTLAGSANAEETFSVSLTSSGAITYTAG